MSPLFLPRLVCRHHRSLSVYVLFAVVVAAVVVAAASAAAAVAVAVVVAAVVAVGFCLWLLFCLLLHQGDIHNRMMATSIYLSVPWNIVFVFFQSTLFGSASDRPPLVIHRT